MSALRFSAPRAAVLLALLTGCTVGPDYKAPETGVAARFAESPAGSAENAQSLAIWWKSFGDRTLDDLIDRALTTNPDLQTAASRVREARFQEISSGAAFWPTVKIDGSAERTMLSRNAVSLGGLGNLSGLSGSAASSANLGGFGLPGASFNTFQIGFDAAWQLDFFGKTRRDVEAADADALAQIWDMRDTQVSLVAEVASTYLNLRYTEERTRIAQSELARLHQTLNLIRIRASGGLVSELDVRQQENEVASTEATIPPLESQVRTQLHALAVLLGQSPEEFSLAASSATPGAPENVPMGLPSQLLRRRPDIREAERKLAAATARIGVAVADFYPQFSLTASPSLSSTMLSKLATVASGGYSLGGSLSWPIFNAGETRAKVNIADEHERQALIAYHKSVLTALKDVEDALVRFAADKRRQDSLQQAATAADAAERIAREQYEGGLVDFSRVLSAEGTHLTAMDDLAQGRSNIAQDWIALYKALGGGWRGEDLVAHPDDSPTADAQTQESSS